MNPSLLTQLNTINVLPTCRNRNRDRTTNQKENTSLKKRFGSRHHSYSGKLWKTIKNKTIKNAKFVLFSVMLRYDNECFENNNVDIPNFEHPVDNMEDDYEDDPEPSSELMRLVE